MFARGHCLLVGVPGLAKTLMIRTLADALTLDFSRIQFTPDLMPADITGTEVIQEDKQSGTRRVQVPPRPDLRQRDPGRRDQPHAAQDAVGPAGGDAGVPDHRRRHAASPGRAVLRAGHAESRSSTKAPIRCPRPSSTGSCSTSASTIRPRTRSSRSSGRRRPTSTAQRDGQLSGPQILGLAADRPPRAGGRSRDPLRVGAGAPHAGPPPPTPPTSSAPTSSGAPGPGPASI